MKTTLPTSYWPSTSYFVALMANDVAIEQYENYQKKSIRNRTTLLTAQGKTSLSVALQKGKNHQLPIKEVLISYDEPWVSNHISTIESAYKNAPYFLYYIEDICDILQKRHETLWDLNTAILTYISGKFLPDLAITYTDAFAGGKHLDISQLSIEHQLRYNQVYENQLGMIVEDISILDLIMNVGIELPNYLPKNKSNRSDVSDLGRL
jgi:hypothetical protein